MAKKSPPHKNPPFPLIGQTEESYGDSFRADLFEQYKLYVASAEKISERRVTANNYLLTVNAFLVTLYGLAAASRYRAHWTILVPITGMLVSATWYLIITSYRNLNTVKFEVIHELERHMPAAVYHYEWERAQEGRGKAYRPLSHLERWIPIIFMILYLVLGIVSAFTKADKLGL
jgi:carbon starvation protein CstA